MRLEKDKGNTTKRMKVAILGRPTRRTLKWSDTMKSYKGMNVHYINNSRDSFSSELRRNIGGK
jgi:hypothetical protein